LYFPRILGFYNSKSFIGGGFSKHAPEHHLGTAADKCSSASQAEN